ncbi:hypothetical protein KM176_02750 [Pseudooceanicola sp. CBS1P-1]|uniref:Lipoprotein n=1 Tax=Pseudooceanicola albus TaxID=2692189 RepID=A0A6L7G1D2_9RHOB|nr:MULTISPECIES: hypothetical protein [Pseudooceanicola]MBT9382770.1 hypothetical protein [Pseudooceanicola endophyticus]MXN17308.1 hypothetical protein [Pseudooceanicola albus]
MIRSPLFLLPMGACLWLAGCAPPPAAPSSDVPSPAASDASGRAVHGSVTMGVASGPGGTRPLAGTSVCTRSGSVSLGLSLSSGYGRRDDPSC